MRFDGRRALVTGGTRGIGRAIQAALSARGCEVIVTGRSAGCDTDLGSATHYRRLELGHPEDISAFVSSLLCEFNTVDILINNAGVNIIEPLESITEQHWAEVIQVDLTAPMVLAKGLLPALRRSSAARVLNVSSIWGVVSKERRISYSAAKTGLIGLTRAMAVELACERILVNALCPGFTMTELTKRSLSAAEMETLSQQVPLGRFATPEEIALAALFLCSTENTYITGQSIVADGGFTIR